MESNQKVKRIKTFKRKQNRNSNLNQQLRIHQVKKKKIQQRKYHKIYQKNKKYANKRNNYQNLNRNRKIQRDQKGEVFHKNRPILILMQ